MKFERIINQTGRGRVANGEWRGHGVTLGSQMLDMVFHVVRGKYSMQQDEHLYQLADTVFGRRTPSDAMMGVTCIMKVKKV